MDGVRMVWKGKDEEEEEEEEKQPGEKRNHRED